MTSNVTSYLDGGDDSGYGITTELVSASNILGLPMLFPDWGPLHTWGTNATDQVACPVADLFIRAFHDRVLAVYTDRIVANAIDNPAILQAGAYQGTQAGGAAAWTRAVAVYKELFEGVKAGTGEPPSTGPITVAFQRAARTITLLPNLTGTPGGGVIERPNLTPRDSYVLDYSVRFETNFGWTADTRIQGKFPGLSRRWDQTKYPQDPTTNGGIDPTPYDAWSFRLMWHYMGEVSSYLYHQQNTGFGEKNFFVDGSGNRIRLTRGRTYRITQFAQVNTPGQPNGIARVFFDGAMVWERTDMVWRGVRPPGESPADPKWDAILYHMFSGGSQPFHAPTNPANDVILGPVYVLDRLPNFTKPVGDYTDTPPPPTDTPYFTIPGRRVTHAPFTSSSGFRQPYDTPAKSEMWAVYDITWGDPDFDWETPTAPGNVIRQSGKFPGPSTRGNPDRGEGNNGTGNTNNDIYPEAYSSRLAFGANGAAFSYIYDQDRNPNSGGRQVRFKNADGSNFSFQKNRKYEIAIHVKINTPNLPDGWLEVYVDRQRKLNLRDIRWRGDTSTNTSLLNTPRYDAAKAALWDRFKFHNYYGGSDPSAPQYPSSTIVGTIRLYDTKPSFLP